MQLVGARGQMSRDIMYPVSGMTLTSAPTMLVLPEARVRSSFLFQNLSANPMFLEIGAGSATATLTSGVVSSITVGNPGFGYTIAPDVMLLGGGYDGNTTYTGATLPCNPPPGFQTGTAMPPLGKQAQAHAVLTNGAISSIVVDYGGSSYAKAPYVLIKNNGNDPNGAADPSYNSGSGASGSGILVAASSSVVFNGTACPTSPIAVYCATSGSRWVAKFTC